MQSISPFNSIPQMSQKRFAQPAFKGSAKVELLGKDISVGVRNFLILETAFFREPDTLEFIKSFVKNSPKQVINIVDGACSSGYETYSIAMLLENIGKKVNILGFDKGQKAINDAIKGEFQIKRRNNDFDDLCDFDKDSFLAFSQKLSKQEQQYKNMFNNFFTDITKQKKEHSFFKRLKAMLADTMTPYDTKTFLIKPEKKSTCTFKTGDILELDKIVPKKSADVILFRNALYHLTTYEAYDRKAPLPDKLIKPAIEQVVIQLHKALNKGGLFVLGTHPSDHFENSGKIIHDTLKNHHFVPVFIENKLPSIWQKL